MSRIVVSSTTLAALIATAALSCSTAKAQQPQFAFFATPPAAQSQSAPSAQPQSQLRANQPATADAINDDDAQLPARLKKQVVNYPSNEAPGTIVIDTPHTFLYYVLGNGKALRYGIGVGREGFTWSGVNTVARKAEWPDWYPPPEMVKRQPYLPRMTAGGPGNPLGARAMYIGNTEYRIHGTNNPATIGKHVSSGCIRLTNEDVIDLFSRVKVGAKVIVLPQTIEAKAKAPAQRAQSRPTPVEDVSAAESYVATPDNRAVRTWNTIRPSGLY
jgi:lipoprotein-anchoring transpeptidase ErfK/SrfK